MNGQHQVDNPPPDPRDAIREEQAEQQQDAREMRVAPPATPDHPET